MKDHVRPALTMLLLMTVLTGLVYPLAVTGLAQVFFQRQQGRQGVRYQGCR